MAVLGPSTVPTAMASLAAGVGAPMLAVVGLSAPGWDPRLAPLGLAAFLLSFVAAAGAIALGVHAKRAVRRGEGRLRGSVQAGFGIAFGATFLVVAGVGLALLYVIVSRSECFITC